MKNKTACQLPGEADTLLLSMGKLDAHSTNYSITISRLDSTEVARQAEKLAENLH
jgi:hypothetical protein